MTILVDGNGRGYSAQVTAQNKLAVDAVSTRAEEAAIREGEGWQIASGLVAFTGDASSAVLWFKNTGAADIVLDRAVLVLSSSDGTGDWRFQTLRNPTVGTIVSSALAAGISNSNHGSAKLPDASVYRGVEGDTLTDGSGVPLPIQQSQNRVVFPLGRRLTTNTSIGFVVTPPPGNTAASAVVVGHIYNDTTGL